MTDAHRYAMLLSALPDHGPLFGAKQTPLSRIRLNQRLALLDPEDFACLQTLGALQDWARQDLDQSDTQAVERANRLVPTIAHPFVRDLVIWRLELRTLVAALRRRRRGDAAPNDNRWGFGRWVAQIRRHWHEPGFRLDGAFPWLPEANRLLALDDSLGLERLLLGAAWTRLERLSDGHYFDFEAVVIYVMRWDLIARWTGYRGEAATQRFDELVAAGMTAIALDPITETRP
ncbi:hypothetical protein [uncultured Thiocystis sp.]|uniref:hypothetical protein n=1 Tax=uncultured Thiocystis sp. TaxID=1202134 RepID=UPI0025EFE15E|nr:hypothetical protein [uncultured Thiocystis sp.]